MTRPDKPVYWVGSVHRDICDFPDEARRRVGHELHQLQQGLLPGDWKTMAAVGPGAGEIRISSELQGGRIEHRVFYVAKFEEAIWVLHAFRKSSRKTRRQDIVIGRKRYEMMRRTRAQMRTSGPTKP